MPFSVENLLFLVMRCFLIAAKKQTTENYNVASYHDFCILLGCLLLVGMYVVLHVIVLFQNTKCYKHQTTKDTGNNVCRHIFSFNFLPFIFSFSLADFFQVFNRYRRRRPRVLVLFGSATNAQISPFTITFAALSLCLEMRRKSIL